MLRSFFKKSIVVLVSAAITVSMNSCGKAPVAVTGNQDGAIELQVEVISGLGKVSKNKQVEFDSLRVSVWGTDFDTLHFSQPLSGLRRFVLDTLSGIPSGSSRFVSVTTVNKNGMLIHSDAEGVRTVTIEPGMVTALPVTLQPCCGSIYMQLIDIPSDVDSVKAFFASEDSTYAVTAKRKPKLFLSIDGIADSTAGVLYVYGIGSSGDTLYVAENKLRVSAVNVGSVDLVFKKSAGGLAMSVQLVIPGAVLATGTMGSPFQESDESGRLLFTEIMYAANDSEYVEIYNPDEEKTVELDTLILEIDGKERLFEDVSVAAGGYLVIGRKSMPWVDRFHSVKSALDLSSTGNMIVLKDSRGTVMDRIVFTGGTNAIEWPKVSGKQSVVLNYDAFSAEHNNAGRNWSCAESLIDASVTRQYGTPRN